MMIAGGRLSPKTKYRFQVRVPKRQVLHERSNAVFRSALTCLDNRPPFF
jgi:hypothetical protein